MDAGKLIEVLRATLDPNQREQAEKQLTEVHKIIGFSPILLQAIMSDQLDMPVRQAGVIYLKNMVTQFWQDREAEKPGDPVPFSIHEHDRAAVREHLIEAIIHAPEPVRVQLCVCISHIIKHDYPGRWPNVPEKILLYIQSDNHSTWMGALMSLYQMVKVYEYKRPDERKILDDAMAIILPVVYQRLISLMPDESEYSVLLQKQILKVFYAFIQNYLPLEVLTKEVFTQWMEAVRQIVDRPVPEQTNQIDVEDRPELAWWKVKKWAVHILARVFERYGSPGNVTKEYTQFSEWYLKSFSGGIIQVLFKVLDQYRQKIYIAPRVLQQSVNYLNQGVSHAFSWKFMKPHMQGIIQEVIFPLMCHSDEDEELWNTDPQEYIRIKYDVFEDFLSPVIAAQTLFYSAASKRKEVLQKAMGFCMQVLTQPQVDPRQKDGALHMIGAVAEVILKRKIYKDQAEMLLATHVFPEFSSEHGFLRARAAWVLKHFCELKFKNEQNLKTSLEMVRQCLCSDKELPVRVEAAVALQVLLVEQEKAKDYIQPFVKPICLELLKVIRETENDDLTSVMQRIVITFDAEVTPLAVEMMTHLAQTFAQVIEADMDSSEEKAITALGILNTMETILNVMENQKEILTQLEGIVLNVIGVILQKNIMDFYEEVLSLIYSLTSAQVSHHMWQVFGMLYEMFQKDGIDYFTDMMPALHNYITVDTPAFLSNPEHIQVIYNMCKQVMSAEIGEDAECHAAKLLEVILLQCPGQVDHVVPLFVELVLQRLTREVLTSELRTMCLQVVIAALYYNPPLLLDTLTKLQIDNITGSILEQFLKQWLHDVDCFLGLHDRKMCVLGLCSLINMAGVRPTEVTNVGPQIMPASLVLFQGLKRAYASKAQEENEDSDDDEDDDEDEVNEELASSEDEIDEEGAQYIEKLEKAANNEDDDSDGEYTDDGTEETALESYQTPLDEETCPVDEYMIFKTVLQNLQANDPNWYNSLISQLTEEQRKEVEEVFKLAEQRRAAAESRKIEERGGYVFQQTSVPSSFNFGS
ncbi:importin-7 isoform X2 [Magallana gigas]|uniref:Importin N-terminal domain-containing protein n=1 Tax=Magallana gigas TaxID=29159 RepID=A0A8W8N7W3_MAGGI|nr:importin-7 isoform X2 [Crassostrea gigas]|eukprot:XP_011439969.1 PREDICTED: importin-7 isoform X1 [Crassostrea gigas]